MRIEPLEARDVPAANQPPVNTVPGTQTVNEDNPLVFSTGNGNPITVSDPDAGTASVRVTLTATFGTVTLAGTAGLTGLSGNGTASVTATGSIADWNTALNGLTFQPDHDFFGTTANFRVVTDDQGNTGDDGAKSDTDDIAITVNSVNDQPTLDPIGDVTVPENALQQTVNLTGISAGAANESLQFLNVYAVSDNTALIPNPVIQYTQGNATGTLKFTPAADSTGTAVITVYAADDGQTDRGGVDTRTRTFTIHVGATNTAPTLSGGPVALAGTDEDTPSVGTAVSAILGGLTYSDPDPGALSGIAVIASAGNGTWQFSVNGTDWTAFGSVSGSHALLLDAATQVRYLPDQANGESAALTFRGWDQTSGSASTNGSPQYADITATGNATAFSDGTAQATLAVSGVNDPPTIAGTMVGQPTTDTATVSPFTGVTIGDVDAPAQTLTVRVSLDAAAKGTLAGTGFAETGPGTGVYQFTGTAADATTAVRALVFTPAQNRVAAGATETTTFTITADDGVAAPVSDANTTVVTTSVNDPPAATNGSLTTDEDTGKSGSLSAVDVDPGTDLTYSVVDQPAHGTLTAFNPNSGAFTYQPAADYHGPDSFTFQASDGTATSNTATATITVNPVNDAPVAADGTLSTDEDTATSGSVGATDVDGDSLTFAVVTGPSHGTLTAFDTASGAFTYKPAADYNGPDSFTFRATDGSLASNTGIISITVNPVNDAPVVTPAAFAAEAGAANGTVIGTVTATDVDGDQPAFAITAGDAAGRFAIDPNTGKLTVADGTLLTTGQYTLTVTATDGSGASGSADVEVTVSARPTTTGITLPAVLEDALETAVGLDPFFDDDGGDAGLTYSLVSADAGLFASAAIAGHQLKFAPKADANGIGTIRVRATDQAGLWVEADASVTVTPVNDAPTVDAVDTVTVPEDAGEQSVSLSGIAVGPANEAAAGQVILSVVAVSKNLDLIPNPITVNYAGGSTATLKFTPVPDGNGSADIEVTVTDSGDTANGGKNTRLMTFTVNVGSAADRPVLHTDGTPMLPPHPTFTNTGYNGPTPFAGGLVSGLTGFVTDADAGALKGLAVTGVDNAYGTWQYNLTGAANGWVNIPAGPAAGAVSPAHALLLAVDADTRVRFVPKAGFAGFASLTIKAWDQSNGQSEGTFDTTTDADLAYSSAADRAWVAVGRTTPVVDGQGRTVLPAVLEDTPATSMIPVRTLLGIAGLEAPTVPKVGLGAAITGTSTADGTWQYYSAKQRKWADIGPVDGTHALLLRPTDVVRFVPRPNADGAGTVAFKTWDQLAGSGAAEDRDVNPNTPAFGADPGAAVLDLIPVNDPPVLDPSKPAILTPVDGPGQLSGEATFASLMSATDVEGANVGVAVYAAAGNGTWQYDDGSGWKNLPAVSSARALLLDAGARVRFQAASPGPLKPGTAALTFKAWDRTTGNLGFPAPPAVSHNQVAGSAFSRDFKVVTVAVNNLAPVLTGAAPTLPAVKVSARPGAGVAVSFLLGKAYSDPDKSVMPRGVAVTGLEGTGTWQYTTNGGATWVAFGSVSDQTAVLLTEGSRVRFVPAAGSGGTTAKLTYKAWDGTAGRNGDRGVDTRPTSLLNSFSADVGTATLNVTG